MASHRITSTHYSCMLVILLFVLCFQSCHGLGSTFGFDIHHRFSDVVTGILGVEGLPEKGSLEYYVAMAHRDRFMRGRHLAATNNQSPPLTFADGNETHFTPDLAFWYYASVSVGTPSVTFLVALDTGSDLFWLPCECQKYGCETKYKTSSGKFNSQVQEKRHSSDPEIPFEYCYDLRPNQTTYQILIMNLTMESGAVYFVSNPTEVFAVQGGHIYCLAIQKSEDISLNIIGQNFMTNYNLVFDRDRMVLGWTWTDNCYGTDENVNSTAPSSSPSQSPAVPSPPAVKPRAPPQAPTKSDSPKLKSFTCALIMIVMLLVSFTAVV
ncbi:Aspartic proteinase-like protein 1 [Morella rubra]|uniref:Aspartic proteinase-like protein 1 n=1 Tax=Morella rubra TaxID=262757 RepID=A0A6A1UNB3_9ROSI|nr:Aspartic proteinase-like protein 1 [Morella rubra]